MIESEFVTSQVHGSKLKHGTDPVVFVDVSLLWPCSRLTQKVFYGIVYYSYNTFHPKG